MIIYYYNPVILYVTINLGRLPHEGSLQPLKLTNNVNPERLRLPLIAHILVFLFGPSMNFILAKVTLHWVKVSTYFTPLLFNNK